MTKKDKSWISPKHLQITIYAGILFLICACVNAGMTNTIMPKICELRGWNYEEALPFMSYGGYIGAVASLLFAELVVKTGAKAVTILGLIGGGICLTIYGSAPSFALFVIAIIGNRVFSCAYQQAGCTALLNNWFPRKKGVVLGWATMGIILSDVIWSPYIPKAIDAAGPHITLSLMGGFFLLLALFTVFCIKNIPEEAGYYPDNNNSGLEDLAASKAAVKAYQSKYTWKKLICTPQVWQIGITWGLLWMIAVAFVSQLVKRCISIGYEPGFSVHVLQIASVIGLFGSWFFGWLDSKFSTKTSSTVYAASISAFFLLGLLQPISPIFVWISACGIMGCVGGIANLAPSMIGTVFGRWDFAAANRLISPLIMVVSSSAFLLASFFIKSPFGYQGMYVACAVIALLCLVSVRLTNDTMIGATSEEAFASIRADRSFSKNEP